MAQPVTRTVSTVSVIVSGVTVSEQHRQYQGYISIRAISVSRLYCRFPDRSGAMDMAQSVSGQYQNK